MPDQPSIPSPENPTPAAANATPLAEKAEPGPTINIAEEFGTAKRSLPPAVTVVATLAAVAVIVGIFSFVQRAKPQGSGQIDNIAAVEVPNQNSMLVALTFTLRNTGSKSLWVHDVKGRLKTAAGEFSDDAASAVDFNRYFEAFPTLKENSQPALVPETKLKPGEETKGTIVVSFPVTQDAFTQRQSLSVVIQPYDQPVPVILTK